MPIIPDGIPADIAARMRRAAPLSVWREIVKEEEEVKRAQEKRSKVSSVSSDTASNKDENRKSLVEASRKTLVSGPTVIACGRPEGRDRYKGWLTGPGRLPGDMPSALRVTNERKRRYLPKIKAMQMDFRHLILVTVYPAQQPAGLKEAGELLKVMVSGMGPDILGVGRFNDSGHFHVHAALPITSVAGSCPHCCAEKPSWTRHTWTSHGGEEERKGWQCPSCQLVWSRVTDLEGCAAYLGSPADELVWTNRKRAAGRWLLAVDKLGRSRPRLSHHQRTTRPLPGPYFALNVLLFPAAIRKAKTRRVRPGAPRKASGREAAPIVPRETPEAGKRPAVSEKRSNGPPG